MSADHTDRNLLFGVLALQADFLDAAQFAEACSAWAARKDTPLADLLVKRGWLTGEDRAHVEYLLRQKLKKHGDAHASLAAAATADVRRVLDSVADPAVRQSLADLPVTRPVLPVTIAYEPGARARYTLTRLHAQGGIGRVWLAHDEDLGRDVALKELRPDRGDSPTAAARFLEEAQITGQLEHPGIVPVYELVRPADGRPCYAMRFVGGRTLADAIADYHRRREAGQTGPLELRELLGAFVGVCNAVAYAHSRGVLHRDLKPANVALGDYGEVLVLDWGLAKVQGTADEPTSLLPVALGGGDGAGRTQQGQVLGTPAYMAPEQARGRPDLVDRRSDVYGLGAILYEVLTGMPPFDGADTPEVLKRVVQEPVVPPRQVVPATPPALEAVCLKALAKEPADRYVSAGELAGDVGRWLADEPVAAYPEPLRARLGRWGRRHRTAVAGAAALLVTAVVALAVGLVLVNAERDKTARANTALAAEKERTQAAYQAEAKRRKQAREALDAMSSQVIDDWLAKQKELTASQKRFLERALASYEEFAQDTGQDEEARAGVAAAYFRVGNIRQRLGQLKEAEEAYRTSQERYARLAHDFPAVPEYRQNLANSHNNLGVLLKNTGRLKEAEGEYRQALDLQQQLAHDFPAVPDYRQDLAKSHLNLGNLLADTGRGPEAQGEYRQALDLQQQLAHDFPAVPDYRQDLAKSHNNLGNLLAATGRGKEAEAEYRQALDLQQQLAHDFPNVPAYRQELATSHNNLGNLFRHTGRGKEAAAEYRQALDLRQQLAHDFPAVPDYRQELATSHNSLGILLYTTGHGKEAEGEFRQALDLQQQLAHDFPAVPEYRQELAKSHNSLGLLLAATGRGKEAAAEYRQALDLQQQLAHDFPAVPEYRHDLAGSHNSLSYLLHNTGRGKEAEAESRQALDLQQQLADDFPAVPRYRQELAASHNNLGALLAATGRGKEAAAEYRQALDLQQQLAHDFPAVSAYRQELARSHYNLGYLLWNTGRGQEAEGEYRQALDLKQQLAHDFPAVPAYRQELALSHNNLGILLRATGRGKEAEGEYRQARDLQQQLAHDFPAVPDYQNELAGTLVNLAELARSRQDYAGARRLLEEALPHHQAALKANPRHLVYRTFFRNNTQALADTSLHLGDHAEAAAAADRLAPLAVDPPNDLYNAACFLARCVPLAAKDDKLPEARRQELARDYADRAMTALRQAVARGFKDVAHLKKDRDLDPLRQRDDFQKLLADLEKAKPGAREPGRKTP
jgi:tetratricopeptide (TPR) repeat protein/tRNA A-37 threonylcarbamoyl transferase component Bud32